MKSITELSEERNELIRLNNIYNVPTQRYRERESRIKEIDELIESYQEIGFLKARKRHERLGTGIQSTQLSQRR